jgi:glycogen debranching enzyme
VDGVLMRTWTVKDDKGYHWEGGISGMDNTPRGRVTEHCEKQRPNNPDMLWIDAICQQALSAKMIAELFKLIDDTDNEKLWLERYNEKKNIVNKYYWDDEDKFYYDINCNTEEFFKIMTIASYWTMTAEIASKEQADHLAKQLFNEKTLHAKAPFLSLSRSDNDYVEKGQYWRGGVWLPTAYATVKGLENYGKFEDAHILATELLEHMYKTYCEFEPHTIWEAYSPEEYKPATNETGRPEYSRPNFCGWSALGPISMYIEQVLGFHTIDAFENVVKWYKPDDIKGKIGIRNLHFGNVLTDIVANGNECTVVSNAPYTLVIRGTEYKIMVGENNFTIRI